MNLRYFILVSVISWNVMCQKSDSLIHIKKIDIEEISLNNFENKFFLDTIECKNRFLTQKKFKKFKNLNIAIPKNDSIIEYELNNLKVLDILDIKNINNTFSLLETKVNSKENYLFESFQHNILSNLFSNNLIDFGSTYMENIGKIYWVKVHTTIDGFELYDLQIMFKDNCENNLFLITISSTEEKQLEETICKFYPIVNTIEVY